MNQLEQLLNRTSERIFDREYLLREILSARVSQWLRARRFYIDDLVEMRDIAHDIMGVKTVGGRDRVPRDLERLHGMPFESLSTTSLRECVVRALGFVGINKMTGADLLGSEGWKSLRLRVQAIQSQSADVDKLMASQPMKMPESTSCKLLSPWAQLAMVDLITEIFEGALIFSIHPVERLAEALNSVRDIAGMARHESKGSTLTALKTLDFRFYDDMGANVKSGIKQAVWEVCGLSEDIGRIAFGDQWPTVEALDFPPPAKVVRLPRFFSRMFRSRRRRVAA